MNGTIAEYRADVGRVASSVALRACHASHADALVRAPGPLVDRVRLIDPPDTSMNGLPTWRRIGPYGDFPLAGLVGQAIADLELHRENAGRLGGRQGGFSESGGFRLALLLNALLLCSSRHRDGPFAAPVARLPRLFARRSSTADERGHSSLARSAQASDLHPGSPSCDAHRRAGSWCIRPGQSGSEDPLHRITSCDFVSGSHAARCVACHGVGSHPVPVALVGECSIPVV